MILNTIVDENFDGAIKSCYCQLDKTSNNYIDTQLWIADTEYHRDAVEELLSFISGWYIQITSIFDCESSSDAGNGRDDYSREVSKEEIKIENCLIKDSKFAGVICEAYGKQALITIDNPKIILGDPHNYEGRGYHCYITTAFELLRKE